MSDAPPLLRLPRRPEVDPPPAPLLRLPRRGDAAPLPPPLPTPPPAPDLRPPPPPAPPAPDLRPPSLPEAARASRAAWSGLPPALRASLAPIPAFLRALPGALLVPLRPAGLIAVAGAGLLLTVALGGLLLSPRLAALVALLAVSQAAALRLRTITEAASGRDDPTWPDLQDGLPALRLHAALAALLLPAALAGLLAGGPAAGDLRGLFTVGAADAEVARLAAEAGEAYQAAARRPLELTREERAAAGVDVAPDAEDERRLEAARALRAELARAGGPRPPASDPIADARAWLRSLDPRAVDSGAGAAARALLLLALLLHPMALLAAAQLQSAAAAWHVPLLLRSIARAAPSYALVAGLCLAADAALVVGAFVVRARLVAGPSGLPGALVSLALVSTAAVALQLVTGAALGRLYRTHRAALAWERRAAAP